MDKIDARVGKFFPIGKPFWASLENSSRFYHTITARQATSLRVTSTLLGSRSLASGGCRSYIQWRRQRERVRRSLCQRQLLLQKPKGSRKRRRIFCHYTAPITSNFMSATPSKQPTSTKQLSDFKASPIPARKRERR